MDRVITPEFAAFHQAVVDTVAALVKLDPPPDSKLGRLLADLADLVEALETFEKAEWALR